MPAPTDWPGSAVGRSRFRWWPPSRQGHRDGEGFTTWPQVGAAMRVVISQETTVTRRQRDGKPRTTESEWVWATTLSSPRAWRWVTGRRERAGK